MTSSICQARTTPIIRQFADDFSDPRYSLWRQRFGPNVVSNRTWCWHQSTHSLWLLRSQGLNLQDQQLQQAFTEKVNRPRSLRQLRSRQMYYKAVGLALWCSWYLLMNLLSYLSVMVLRLNSLQITLRYIWCWWCCKTTRCYQLNNWLGKRMAATSVCKQVQSVEYCSCPLWCYLSHQWLFTVLSVKLSGPWSNYYSWSVSINSHLWNSC